MKCLPTDVFVDKDVRKRCLLKTVAFKCHETLWWRTFGLGVEMFFP